MQKLSDNMLIELIKENNSEAKNAFYKKYFSKLKAFFLYKRVHNKELREDFTQETMIKFFEKVNTYKYDRNQVNTWLYTIAKNHLIDHIRKKDREGFKEEIKNYKLKSFLPNPEQKLITKDITQIITLSVMKLPEKQKKIMASYLFEDLSYKEISKKLGLSMGTIKANIFRGKEKLMGSLESKIYK